jgi:hypothetical protein
MNWTYAIIIGVLIYIAYQLVELNRSKKGEILLKVAEKNEEMLDKRFPNLYKNINEGAKGEIMSFLDDFLKQSNDDLTDYLYLNRFKVMNTLIKSETNSERKKMMEDTRDVIMNDMKKCVSILHKSIEEKKATDSEKDFVIWMYLNKTNENFPDIESMSNFISFLGFDKLLSLKN